MILCKPSQTHIQGISSCNLLSLSFHKVTLNKSGNLHEWGTTTERALLRGPRQCMKKKCLQKTCLPNTVQYHPSKIQIDLMSYCN